MVLSYKCVIVDMSLVEVIFDSWWCLDVCCGKWIYYTDGVMHWHNEYFLCYVFGWELGLPCDLVMWNLFFTGVVDYFLVHTSGVVSNMLVNSNFRWLAEVAVGSLKYLALTNVLMVRCFSCYSLMLWVDIFAIRCPFVVLDFLFFVIPFLN